MSSPGDSGTGDGIISRVPRRAGSGAVIA